MADEKNIKFMGNRADREDALKFVDQAVKKMDGDEGAEEFTKGIDALSQEYKILVIDDDDSYSVILESLAKATDKMDFVIEKATGAVYRPDGTKNFKKGGDDDVDFLDEI